MSKYMICKSFEKSLRIIIIIFFLEGRGVVGGGISLEYVTLLQGMFQILWSKISLEGCQIAMIEFL